MSLLYQSDEKVHPLENSRMSVTLWFAAFALAGWLIILALLGRLGLPVSLTYASALTFFTIAATVLAWRGRTMTGRSFFFADRMGASATTGFGGGADFAGGAMLMIFLSMSVKDQAYWVTSAFLGMVMMSALFAHILYREHVSTVTGFFAIRYPAQGAGMVSVPVVLSVLMLIAIAEFGVARAVMEKMNPDGGRLYAWILLALAVLPTLIGGWFSIILVNAVLALWTMMAILVPAFLLGLVPGILSTDSASLIAGSVLQPLPLLEDVNISEGGFWLSLLTVLVFACGFSVLPQSFSRTATGKRPSSTMEHIGWAGLFLFVTIAASGLSIALISNASDSEQAKLLTNNPMLHFLPYLALLFLAFNALSTTLLAFSSAAVRSFRRSRKKDPGEQSMFATRLVCVMAAVLIGQFMGGGNVPIATAFFTALVLGAGGLFVPLLAAAQVRNVPAWSVGLAIVLGTSISLFSLVAPSAASLPNVLPSPVPAAALAMSVCAVVLSAGWVSQNKIGRRA